ncbi:hypothetical protein [Flavobacterium columnare]|uniref:hypothetical protein n=1 Tax=Flavobacterium columnare TaxID=996 RepID=UPI001BC87828|nr:hypothetical protein [Flavobacterium columnare]AUX17364.1 hypothetical protein AQ623_02935 [Flavobacterium columnare]
MKIKDIIPNFLIPKNLNIGLAKTDTKPFNAGLVNSIAQKSLSRVRQDVGTWNTALTMARKAEKPKRHLLYNLYDEISIDGLLRSQLSNRFLKSLASSFTISDKTEK